MNTQFFASQRKTDQVKASLLEQILASGIKPGDRLPGENELTRRFGVARNTIREAVASLVQEGTLVRRKGSGTYLQQLPQSHPPQTGGKSPLTLRVGFVAFCTEVLHAGAYVARIMRGLTEPAELVRRVDLKLLTSYPEYRNLGGIHYTEIGAEDGVDGLVVGVNVGIDSNYIKRLSDQGITTVFLTYEPILPGYPWVCQDLIRGVQNLVPLVYQAGHRRMGMMLYRPMSEAFLMGYMMGHTLAGKKLHLDSVVYCRGNDALIPALTDELLGKGVDAVLCYDDEIAVKVIRYLGSKGIRVPEDVAVIGINDTANPDRDGHPPLTTIHMPMEEMGRACRDLLVMSRLGQNVAARSIVLESKLIIRDTGLANVADRQMRTEP